MAGTGGPWTRHGHDIPGVTVAGSQPPAIARCGGPALCRLCREDVAQARGEQPAAPARPTPDQLDDALASADIAVGPSMPALAAEVRALHAERAAVLALAAEWELDAARDYSRQNLTGNEIWEMVGEQSTCRTHARELREALGDGR